MCDWTIREYTPADVPQMAALWQRSFGDSEGFVQAFFAALPDMGSGVVAVCGEKVIGAAYTLNGQELLDGTGAKAPVIGYLYGVSVEREYRHHGIGGALVKAVYALSQKREAKIVCTLPAEASLYDWYEKLLGLRPVLYRKKQAVKAAQLELSMELSSTEYMIWRENMLRGQAHLHLSNYALEFEKKLLKEYGGGFFAVESGIAAAYVENGVGLIRELIVPDSKLLPRAASSVAYALGVEQAWLYLPASAQDGERYIAADSALPEGCIWNLSFD